MTPESVPTAVVLLSGGVDSATALAIARADGFEPHCLSFRYGQRHAYELIAARAVATGQNVKHHRVIDIDLRQFGGSALTGDVRLPTDRTTEQMSAGVAPTYVPARNTIFLSYALAWAEVLGSQDVYIGVNYADHAGYPDCRPEYVKAYERLANLATRAGAEGKRHLTIHAPLIEMDKAQIIRRGLALGVDYGLTSTCYDPMVDGAACGRCDACVVRIDGFQRNGLTDPAKYRAAISAAGAG